MTITKDTTISDVLMMNRNTAPIFMSFGMHCLSCPCATAESIEEACEVHGTDADALVEKLNAFVAENALVTK